MAKVAFRVDANPRLGMGHIRRCQALAQALFQQGFDITFVMANPDPSLVKALASSFPARVISIPPGDNRDNVALTQNALKQQTPWDWLIIDHYAWDAGMEKAMRPLVQKILVIDDLANRPHDADILVDQNFYPNATKRYHGKTPNHCVKLLGPSYALLHPQFAALRNAHPKHFETVVSHILVSFGGGDVSTITQVTLEALATLPDRPWQVHVIPGAIHLKPDALAALDAKLNLFIHFQPDNIAQLMHRAQFAIGGGGTMTWERCCMGLPSLVFTLAENQQETTQALADSGIIAYEGSTNHLTPNTLASSIQTLLNNPKQRQHLFERSLSLVDGLGAERVVSAMLSYPAPMV